MFIMTRTNWLCEFSYDRKIIARDWKEDVNDKNLSRHWNNSSNCVKFLYFIYIFMDDFVIEIEFQLEISELFK